MILDFQLTFWQARRQEKILVLSESIHVLSWASNAARMIDLNMLIERTWIIHASLLLLFVFFCFFANLITFLLTDRNSLVKILSIVDLISSSQNAKMSNVKTKAFSWIYLLKHLFLLETDIFPEDHFRSTSMTPSRSAINKKKKKRQGNGFWSGVVSISLRCHPLRQTSNMPHDTSSGCALFLFKSMILFSS